MGHALRKWLAKASWVGLAWLSGCGGGGGGGEGTPAPSTQGVQTQPASTVTATIGASGGQVSATSASGVRYTLFIPPGALAADTAISVTPITSMGDAPLAQGLRGAARFAPSGLVFQREATLRIEGAAPARAGLLSVGFSRSEDGQTMRLSLPDRRSGALDMAVFHFSDAGVADATAAEVASVPLATPSEILFERMLEIMVREPHQSDAEMQAVLSLVFDQIVKPALDAGAASNDIGLREKGLLAFDTWLAAFANGSIVPDVAGLNAQLARNLTVARAQAAGLLKGLLQFHVANCVSDPENVGFESAMRQRRQAVQLNLATPEFGLAPADTLRLVNDCIRLVIDPISFPDTVTVGTPRSLDSRARLVLATAPQNLLDATFEFTVTSNDVLVASPTGLSDFAGRYTVVLTPRTATPEFAVKACYVLAPLVDNFITDLCTTVSVPDGAPPTPFTAVTFAGVYTPSSDSGGKACAIGERSGPGGNNLTAFLTLDDPSTGSFILDTQNDNRDDNRGFFARIGLSWAIGSGGAFDGSGGGAFSFSDRVTYQGTVIGGVIDLAVDSITRTGVACSGRFVGSQTEVIKR